jgi:KaiC/GvpD/RAD55 family RecA-like ATPase
MSVGRVATGVEGLDSLIEGGFPRNSVILVAGNPGTGKTVLSAQFLYRGAVDYGENGVYVSFAEDRETFYENMRQLGLDFERLEREGRFRFLSLMPVKESVIPSVVKVILEEIRRVEAKRIVIDSLSALTEAFIRPHDARIFIQTVLGRIIRKAGCTAMITIEVPFGTKRIGLGIEEFVADGVIHLKAGRLEERLFRELRILKMRGTRIKEDVIGFTIKDGFRAFTPFEAKPIQKRREFKPIPDPPGRFSTGSQDLDEILGGGYPHGSTVFLEVGRSVLMWQYHLVLLPTCWNFLAKGVGVVCIPESGVDHETFWKRSAEAGLPTGLLGRRLRICIFRPLARGEGKPYTFEVEGRSLEEDLHRCLDAVEELRRETGQPVLFIVGADTLLARYGSDETIRAINSSAALTRESSGLLILVLRPGYPWVSEILNALAEVHLKLIQKHGALLIYGLKPRIRLHFVEMDIEKGYPLPKLTAIM